MKLIVRSIFREALIVLSLALFSSLFVIVVGGSIGRETGMPFVKPFHWLFILGLLYLTSSCGVLLAFGTRKWWCLAIRSVVSGVVAAVLMIGAVAAGSIKANMFAHMALGEGGIVHQVGEARMRTSDGELTYSVYWGKVKHGDGCDLRELILLANDRVKRKSFFCCQELLVGKSQIFHAGLSVVKIFPGLAAVHGAGIDITSDKIGADAKLSISDSDGMRTYRCDLLDWNGTSWYATRRTYSLDVPLSCIAKIGEDPQEESGAADSVNRARRVD